MRPQRIAHMCLVVVCAAMLVCGGVGCLDVAVAEEPSESARLQAEADSMVATIEETTEAYRQAEADVEYLEGQIASNENRAAEIEKKLPAQRARTAACVKELYLYQRSTLGFLDLIFSAKDFNQFISTIRYIDTIHERNTDEIEQLVDMTTELDLTKQELVLERDTAQQKEAQALEALDEAREVRRQLQERADAAAAAEAEERAKAIAAAQAAIEAANARAEQEAREAAQASESDETKEEEPADTDEPEQTPRDSDEEQQARGGKQKKDDQEREQEEQEEPQDTQATFTTSSGNTAPVEVPEEDVSASTEPLTTNTTSEESSGWAARIDAYLAGSPLAGYGATFAKAAATYGVDPRLSPAISCVESSKGAICFLPHNAWGWGRSSWSDWESAINDHVAGLASGYGGTLTLEGAMRYCPPTYQEWYSSVLAEMNSI
ncbi:MAG: hypothetical protein Q4A07_04255 [Coriobacteriales bacterium]|nr:hypothetical protein [Coriobacteriales bacterium]